jgi:rsbT antagonist protein RsbS
VSVPILKQGKVLIASVQAELTDSDWAELRDTLLARVGKERSSAVVVDVGQMSVLDSYAGKMLSSLGDMLRLRGARTVVVGIQPEVAFAMVQLGLHLGGIHTALDLEDGLIMALRPVESERSHGR